LIFQVLNKVTGGKLRGTRRSFVGRQLILKALESHDFSYITLILDNMNFHNTDFGSHDFSYNTNFG
jgi:hypothetical protein